jgi:bifunctional NMN adenylyltransferase/nudix hydrolase
MKNLAVIYAPFQVADIASDRLLRIVNDHEAVVVVLPVKRFPNSMDAPMDFQTRQMMLHEQYPFITVLPFPEEKYPAVFVQKLEALISAVVSPLPKVTLFTPDPPLYEKNGGRWSTRGFLVEPIERDSRKEITPLASRDFRAGVIYACNRRFPISWMTVDMAITRKIREGTANVIGITTELLLGRKPGETAWRFPGGFKDRRDATIEDAVKREGLEEVIGKTDKPASDFFEEPIYLGSRNIADWRYDGDSDGITTVFFEMRFIGDHNLIKASDDLEATRWADISEIRPSEVFVPEHAKLWDIFVEKHR